MSAEYLSILGSDYGVWGFKFLVSNHGKLKVNCVVLDDLKNEFPLETLSSY